MALTDYSYSRRNKGVENVVRSIGLDENWVRVAKKYSTQSAITCPKLTIETTRTRFETCQVNNKDITRTRRYQCRSGSVTPCFIVSVVNFELVNTGWERQL